MRGYKLVGAFLLITTFFALAGGAQAAKLGDREVKARHIDSGAVHCRALDKYLKGHLCGPNATIKKVGQAGPPGPPGPSGGSTEIFYVGRAVTPRAQIFDGDGLTLHATCDTSALMTLEVTADVAGGTLRSSATIGDDDVEYQNLENLGTSPVETFNYTQALLTMSYLHANGSNMTGTFQVDNELNGALNDTRDCVFAGFMNQ